MTIRLEGLQRRMTLLLLGTYLLGAFFPWAGVAMRRFATTIRTSEGGELVLSLPMFMVGFLLFVAGVGTDLNRLRRNMRPRVLLAGLFANTAYPVAFAAVASLGLLLWRNTAEAQSILVGLAMIGAMPIAGASTAWTQNADGSVALCLALVLASTLLSPILTPLGLHAIGILARGDYSEDLHELARSGSGVFVALTVVVPSVLGIGLRALIGTARAEVFLPWLKLLNLLDLLVLNYSNASLALPNLTRHPDWDFLALTLAIVSTMCVGAFAFGWLLARRLRVDRADETALIYSLGMSNNGTGLVLAATTMTDHPLVLSPIIFYNLVQQVVAGVVDAIRRRGASRSAEAARAS